MLALDTPTIDMMVTGIGTPTEPFIISANALGGAGSPTVIQVTDTPSVDMTLSGTGSTADPYVLSAVTGTTPPVAPDEVIIQAGVPADPAVELWVDTDEVMADPMGDLQAQIDALQSRIAQLEAGA